MPRWIIPASVAAIVLVRASVFLLSPESYFDSDQAVVGLMAKHLSELRAFPVFLYGQTYMLGVEAWLAAPLFVVFGPSIAALKLPVLAMNAAVAVLLVRTFEREMALTPLRAVIASLPFIVPSVGLSAMLMESSGGTVEPFLYILLLWALRRRPWLCGLVFGIGFLNREFTVYGLAALIVLEAFDRRLFTPEGIRYWARVFAVAAVVWVAVQGLKHLSSASGPGTDVRDTFTASNNLAELAARTCVSPVKAAAGAGRLFTIHWPALLGTGPRPVSAFAVESRVSQGFTGASWLPLAVVLLSIAGVRVAKRRAPDAPAPRFAQFLMLTGCFSVAGYLFGRCGEVNFFSARYDLLSLLAIVGLAGWFLSVRPPAALLTSWSVVFGAWMLVVIVPQVRFIAEYSTRPPVPAKHQLIRALEAQGIRYGRADYWLAYYIDFLTRERIIIASDAPKRILLYDRLVADHAAEAVRLSRRPCDGGSQLIPGVYRCP
jgi:hypothetical protein